MLHVTKLDERSTRISLKVVGEISSETCDDLRLICHSYLCEGKALQLDLSGVSAVSPLGVEMLRALQRQPVDVVFVPPLTCQPAGEDSRDDCA